MKIKNLDFRRVPFKLYPKKADLQITNWENFHAHQGMEFIYIHEGQGRIIVDQQIYQVKAGTLLYFQPFQLHRIIMEGQQPFNFVRTVFIFEPTVFDPYLQHFPGLRHFFHHIWRDKLSCQAIENLSLKNHFTTLYEQVVHRLSLTDPSEQFEEYALFIIYFLQKVRSYWENEKNKPSLKPINNPTTYYADQIVQWLEKNYKSNVRLEDLAANLHLSTSHVSRLFRHATGSTIVEYLTTRRLSEACLLLKTSTLSIEQIGQMVGFDNYSYFCRIFKKNMGHTPLQYRFAYNHFFSKP